MKIFGVDTRRHRSMHRHWFHYSVVDKQSLVLTLNQASGSAVLHKILVSPVL